MTETADLLAAVELSPRAAAAHDRAGWVGLFTVDGRIEDPVGSRPHVGHAQIGRFYDTFIAPRRITFHRDLDVVQGTTVVRDLTLEVGMASRLTMNIPAYLRYDLRASDGRWEIAALSAYWELPAMAFRMLRQGVSSLPASAALTAGLLRNQGIRGAGGFLSGLRGAGRGEKLCVGRFLDAAIVGDRKAAIGELAPEGFVTMADAKTVGTGDLVERLRGGSWCKLIAAGDTVSASVATASERGVIFFEIPSAASRITRIRFFCGSGGGE